MAVFCFVFLCSFAVLCTLPSNWVWRLFGVLAVFPILFLWALSNVDECGLGCVIVTGLAFAYSISVGLAFAVWTAVRFFHPTFGKVVFGARWEWLADTLIAVAYGVIIGAFVFVQMTWAFSGLAVAPVHLVGIGVCAIMLVTAIYGIKQRRVLVGCGVLGIALVWMAGFLYSLNYENRVLRAAGDGTYCIYFPQADEFYDGSMPLALLTMEKSRDGNHHRHALLGRLKGQEVQIYHWSFYEQEFHRDHWTALYSTDTELEQRFRQCIQKAKAS